MSSPPQSEFWCDHESCREACLRVAESAVKPQPLCPQHTPFVLARETRASLLRDAVSALDDEDAKSLARRALSDAKRRKKDDQPRLCPIACSIAFARRNLERFVALSTLDFFLTPGLPYPLRRLWSSNKFPCAFRDLSHSHGLLERFVTHLEYDGPRNKDSTTITLHLFPHTTETCTVGEWDSKFSTPLASLLAAHLDECTCSWNVVTKPIPRISLATDVSSSVADDNVRTTRRRAPGESPSPTKQASTEAVEQQAGGVNEGKGNNATASNTGVQNGAVVRKRGVGRPRKVVSSIRTDATMEPERGGRGSALPEKEKEKEEKKEEEEVQGEGTSEAATTQAMAPAEVETPPEDEVCARGRGFERKKGEKRSAYTESGQMLTDQTNKRMKLTGDMMAQSVLGTLPSGAITVHRNDVTTTTAAVAAAAVAAAEVAVASVGSVTAAPTKKAEEGIKAEAPKVVSATSRDDFDATQVVLAPGGDVVLPSETSRDAVPRALQASRELESIDRELKQLRLREIETQKQIRAMVRSVDEMRKRGSVLAENRRAVCGELAKTVALVVSVQKTVDDRRKRGSAASTKPPIDADRVRESLGAPLADRLRDAASVPVHPTTRAPRAQESDHTQAATEAASPSTTAAPTPSTTAATTTTAVAPMVVVPSSDCNAPTMNADAPPSTIEAAVQAVVAAEAMYMSE